MLLALRRIAQEIYSSDDLNAALVTLVQRVRSSMNIAACSVYLWDPDARCYTLVATDGLNAQAVGQVSLNAKEGIVALAGSREEVINLADASQHSAYHLVPDLDEESLKALMAVPIIHHRKLMGVLTIQSEQAQRFSEADEAVLVTLSAQLAGLIAHTEATEGIHLLKASAASEYIHNRRYEGICGATGIAIGVAYLVTPPADLNAVIESHTDTPELEIEAFARALESVRQDIQRAGQQLSADLRPEEQALFNVYLGILDDQALGSEVVQLIRQGHWAQGALAQVIKNYVGHFQAMDDAYLRERATDIRDLGRRVLAYLQQQDDKTHSIPDKAILMGEEMTPAILGELSTHNIAGIVCTQGSANSHIAILARALGIPTVMGVVDLPCSRLLGKELVIDGYRGQVYCDLSDDRRQHFEQVLAEERQFVRGLESLKSLPCETLDGHRIQLLVNTGLMTDIVRSQDRGAEGVGLYRTEVPFMLRDSFPSESEQTAIYRKQLEAFAPLPVTMRTLDIGGDKSLSYFPIEEDNPFLGWRGIRVMLDHPEIFTAQIRAMLRASEGLDNLRILLPMISSASEFDDAQQLIHKAVYELKKEGYSIAMPQIGAMIEVPAAVYQVNDLAAQADFLSVGTNDLTQYLLAVDRNNPRVASIYDSLHPAVIHALMLILQQAQAMDTPVSICGELAGDPIGAMILVGMGYTTLSMSAAHLLRIKSILRQLSYPQLQQLGQQITHIDDPRIVRSTATLMLKSAGIPLTQLGISVA